MSNQAPAAAGDPHPFTIRAPSTEGSVSNHQLQRGRATLFTYSLRPEAARQLHANSVAEALLPPQPF
eukprot:366442-Chlamydomonas_euryale.AAC.28